MNDKPSHDRLSGFDPAVQRSRHGGRSKAMLQVFKFAFLAIAVVLAVITFTWSSFIEEDFTDAIEDVAVDVAVRDELLSPRFNSEDEQGQPYVIEAKRAVRKEDHLVSLEEPIGRITFDTGRWFKARAQRGVYDQDKKTLVLKGAVYLSDSLGYALETQQIHVDLKRNIAKAPVAVQGQGPAGHLRAGGITFFIEEGRVTFKGPVEMRVFADKAQDTLGGVE